MTQESTVSRRAAREQRSAEHGYQSTKRSSRSSNSRSWVWIAVAAVCVVVLLAVAVDAFASAGRVHPGVSVAGVHVGGMTPSEATAALEKELPAKSTEPVTVAYGKESWTVAPGDIALSFDYPGLVAQSMAVGREGGFASSVSARLAAWFGKEQLPAVGVADAEKLAKALDTVAKTTDVPARDATVVVDGTSAEVKPSADGVELKRDELSRAILASYTTDKHVVAAPVQTAHPKISNDAAEAAKSVALNMMSDPLTVTYSGKRWTFSPTDIGKMIEFQSVEPTGSAARSGKKGVEAGSVSDGDPDGGDGGSQAGCCSGYRRTRRQVQDAERFGHDHPLQERSGGRPWFAGL